VVLPDGNLPQDTQRDGYHHGSRYSNGIGIRIEILGVFRLASCRLRVVLLETLTRKAADECYRMAMAPPIFFLITQLLWTRIW